MPSMQTLEWVHRLGPQPNTMTLLAQRSQSLTIGAVIELMDDGGRPQVTTGLRLSPIQKTIRRHPVGLLRLRARSGSQTGRSVLTRVISSSAR